MRCLRIATLAVFVGVTLTGSEALARPGQLVRVRTLAATLKGKIDAYNTILRENGRTLRALESDVQYGRGRADRLADQLSRLADSEVLDFHSHSRSWKAEMESVLLSAGRSQAQMKPVQAANQAVTKKRDLAVNQLHRLQRFLGLDLQLDHRPSAR